MIKEPRISLFDLVSSLSNAMDLVDSSVVNHQKRVAYIAYFISLELGLDENECIKILLAGYLHDCGVLSLEEKLSALEFEFGMNTKECERHSIIGYQLLSDIPLVSNIAPLVRYHHVRWEDRDKPNWEEPIPVGSHILHLADRIEVLIHRNEEILGQVKRIIQRIEEESGRMFDPELVEIIKTISRQECFWLDLASPFADKVLARKLDTRLIEMDLHELLDIAQLYYKIIDFRSAFTATHSIGVATSAEAIAGLAGFSETERKMMLIAGYLHDLGKLAVPTEILEKNGSLNDREVRIIKSHTYYTYRILEGINGMETINSWASFHHERLNGNGYPFHLKGDKLPLGSRILAAADVLTALTEDRPYRKAMPKEKVLEIMERMVDNQNLDAFVVHLLINNFDQIDIARKTAQAEVLKDFRSLWSIDQCKI